METKSFLLSLLHLALLVTFSLSQEPALFSKRFPGEAETQIQCIHMESFDGDYFYVSPGGDGGMVCGLFVIGQAEQLIEVTFSNFDISCESGGLLATVDGWETQGQFFPSDLDHQRPFEERYKTYCGNDVPTVFISSQNVALIQYRIPAHGEGFRVSIRMIDNPEPCNVVTMLESGTMTIRNFGHKRNCSVSIMYPEGIRLISTNVGAVRHFQQQIWQTPLVKHCKKRLRDDYVEMLTGPGLDTSLMPTIRDYCGVSRQSGTSIVPLVCGHSVVRLVSSGRFSNSVSFRFDPLPDESILKHAAVQCGL